MKRTLIQLTELYMTAELVWYILHDGEERLYEYVLDQCPRVRDAAVHWVQVQRTLHHIRRLPEE